MQPYDILRLSLESPSNLEIHKTSISKALNIWQQEPTKITFETADLCGSDLYLGLSDGSVAHYILDSMLHSSQNELDSKLVNRIGLSKSRCQKIEALPSISKLTVQTGIRC